MLARVLLCLRPSVLEDRLAALMDAEDVVLERVRGPRGQLWSQAIRRAGDVVILGRELVPSPAARHVQSLRDSPESPAVIVLADHEDPDDRARLLAGGAEEVLSLDLSDDLLREILLGIVAKRREASAERLRIAHPGGDPRLGDFVSASRSMQAFMEVVHRVVDSDSSLLLLGETGVGKERLARAIHAESRRAGGPFVAVNCGAIPEALLESELFGHERGAFTGASRARRGWFELGHGGTVFLDEIGDLPLHVQVKLLRVLQEREVQPLGSERSMRVDVRIMAASNRGLEAEVERGTFRRDLFYRLNVVSLELPPLRERREDIPDLVASFVGHFARTIGRDVRSVEDPALDALVAHDWPGNVRELMNVLERAVLLCDEDVVGLADLPVVIKDGLPADGTAAAVAPDGETRASEWLPVGALDRPLATVRREVLDVVERAYLEGLLAATRGRIGETAARAGIQPRSLYEKMRRLGLRKEDFRATGTASLAPLRDPSSTGPGRPAPASSGPPSRPCP